MRLKNVGTILAKMVTAGMLFGALARSPYDYYRLLRWVVCGVSALAAFQAGLLSKGKSGWVWALATTALVFNPFLPAHFKRETWAFIDVGAAGILLASIVPIDRGSPK
jgi:hypothetical protein